MNIPSFSCIETRSEPHQNRHSPSADRRLQPNTLAWQPIGAHTCCSQHLNMIEIYGMTGKEHADFYGV